MNWKHAQIIVVMLVLVGCVEETPQTNAAETAPHRDSWRSLDFTRDTSDQFSLHTGHDTITVTANPNNTDGNTRTIYWRPTTPATRDQTSCATFDHSVPNIQPGIALQIRQNGTTTQAITLTMNVWLNANWIINAHTWNSAKTPPMTQFIGWDMKPAIDTTDIIRLCGRTTGNTLTMKAWPITRPNEPSWTDPTYTRRADIPTGQSQPGRPGTYAGHLTANQSLTLSEITDVG